VVTTWQAVRGDVAQELRTRSETIVIAWEQATGAARECLIGSFTGIVDELAGASCAEVAVRVVPPRGVDVVAADYGWVRHALRDELFGLVPPDGLRDALAALDRAVDRWTAHAIAACQHDLDESRERLVAILAHDLRTPLSCIAMGAELLLARHRGDKHADALHVQILAAADRMHRMVTDVLDLARTRLGHELPIAPRRDDLGDICRSAIEELALANPGRRIVLDTRGDLSGMFDRDRVVQAIGNLVRNAIEHGVGAIQVRAAEDAERGGLVVDVTNCRAAQASGPLPIVERSVARLGFGLYIVHKIAAAHGATCAQESTSSETTYSIRWPRVR
jgi:signal transduction histidine kinase